MKFLFAPGLAGLAARRPWLSRLLWRLEAAIMYGLWWWLRCLGPESAAGFGAVFLRALGPCSRAKAALVRQQLRVIEPLAEEERIQILVRRSWENLGMVLGEYAHLERIAAERLELVDHAGLERYGAAGSGAIFFGAHYANWELLAPALTRAGLRMVALYAAIANPWLDTLMARARRQYGCDTHARGASLAPLLRHLQRGGCVGSLIDLRVKDGAELPFFGHLMPLPTTMARLAQRTGAELVPLRVERTGLARYRLHVGPVLAPVRHADPAQAALATTRLMMALMEEWIAADPGLWLLANRRWDKRLLSRIGEMR